MAESIKFNIMEQEIKELIETKETLEKQLTNLKEKISLYAISKEKTRSCRIGHLGHINDLLKEVEELFL